MTTSQFKAAQIQLQREFLVTFCFGFLLLFASLSLDNSWYSLVLAFASLGLLFLVVWLRNLRGKHLGICCPTCGLLLDGHGGAMALATGLCRGCGCEVIQASSVPSSERGEAIRPIHKGAGPSNAIETVETGKRQIVLMVHGTFAACAEDVGSTWWQLRSEFRQKLESRLAPASNASLHEPGFHWSGENTESARLLAARELLDQVARFEASEQPYHLVGHSHGGSVIWAALQMSLERFHNGLGYLQSWTTVGTPFLHFGRRDDYLAFSGPGLSLSCLPVGFASFGLLVMVSPTDMTVVNKLIWSALLSCVGMATLILGVAGLIALGEVHSYLTKQRKQTELALSLYAKNWLGLWSPDDEAINGLSRAMKFQAKILPRRRLRLRAYSLDRWLVLTRPFIAILNWLHNKMLAPLGDRFICRAFARFVQGHDWPGFHLLSVRPEPSPLLAGAPALPQFVCDALSQAANQAAAQCIPQFRALLNRPRLGTILESQTFDEQKPIQASALIHSSYFENDAVIDLISLHIRECGLTTGKTAQLEGATSLLLADWYLCVKRHLEFRLQRIARRGEF